MSDGRAGSLFFEKLVKIWQCGLSVSPLIFSGVEQAETIDMIPIIGDITKHFICDAGKVSYRFDVFIGIDKGWCGGIQITFIPNQK